MLLEIKNITKYFGGLKAVNDVDFYVNEGEIVGLMGPNGAGKSTLFNLITGYLKPVKGRIMFEGKDITSKKPHLIAESGIGWTFQSAPVFSDFTVLQNIIAASCLHPKIGFWETFLNTSACCRKEKLILDRSLEILQVTGLDKVKDERAKNLPHGFQKMLGIARALAVRPKLLLIDEPTAGMSRKEIDFTMPTLQRMRQGGLTILLIEHNMNVMNACERIIVLNYGVKIAEGSMADVRRNKNVIQAYFKDENAA